jgi:type IV pilus assembly protein PilN
MPRINLLPWRDEERKERKLAFFVAIGGATVAGGVVAFAAYLMLNSMIESQVQRNERLRAEIRQLDKQIEEINNLESSKQKFIARMEIIEKLQRSRPEIVHLFDEIVKQLPEGVYLTGVKQTDKRMRFDGIAQSSTRVSAFMRNIDGSEWLRGADLEIVQSAAGNTPGQAFTLYADQVSNVNDDDKRGPGNKKLASAGGNK